MSEVTPSQAQPAEPLLYTYRNHWKFGWGEGLYNFRDRHLPFWVKFGPSEREPKDFRAEVLLAARKIAETVTKPLFVALSGGIDSELVARALLIEGVPFTPLIAQFNDDYNGYDIAYAFDFCRQYDLKPEVISLDVHAFLEQCVETSYILAKCPHLLHMRLISHAASCGGAAIIALGEQRYRIEDGTVMVPVPIERIAILDFMQQERMEAVPAFYYYTPELILSIVREAKSIGFEGMSLHAHNVKATIYHKHWPELPSRPKYDGFEMVQEKRKMAQATMQLKHGPLLIHPMIPIDELERQLTGAP